MHDKIDRNDIPDFEPPMWFKALLVTAILLIVAAIGVIIVCPCGV